MQFDKLTEIKQAIVYRNSGRPVDVDDEARYIEEFRAFYDKATARAGLDMLKLDRFLSFGEFCLQKKHYKPTYISSLSELAELHYKYGKPLMAGLNDDSTLLIIIQDV